MRKTIEVPADLFLSLVETRRNNGGIWPRDIETVQQLVKVAELPRLSLHGREWFHKTAGNTYQSVSIYADDVRVAKVGPKACHGQHYLFMALDWLLMNKPELVPGYVNGGHPTIYLREMQGQYSMEEVPRERDL